MKSFLENLIHGLCVFAMVVFFETSHVGVCRSQSITTSVMPADKIKIETSYFQNSDYVLCVGDFEVGKMNQIVTTNNEQKIALIGLVTNKTVDTVDFSGAVQVQTKQGSARRFNVDNIELYNGQEITVGEMVTVITNRAGDGTFSVTTNHVGAKISATWNP